MNPRTNKVIKFLNKSIDTILTFKKGNGNVSYEDIIMLPHEFTEIAENCMVRLMKGYTSFLATLECSMKAKSILGIHKHSNYDEEFRIISGIMKDRVSGIILKAGDVHTFKADSWHKMECIEDAFMEIRCIKSIDA